jgi:hypothetical protein
MVHRTRDLSRNMPRNLPRSQLSQVKDFQVFEDSRGNEVHVKRRGKNDIEVFRLNQDGSFHNKERVSNNEFKEIVIAEGLQKSETRFF